MTGEQIRLWTLAAVAAVGAAVGLFKVRPDRARALVESASSLVSVSEGLMNRLQVEVKELQEQVAELQTNQAARDKEIDDLRATIRQERREHHREVIALSERVATLERTLQSHDIPVPPDNQ